MILKNMVKIVNVLKASGLYGALLFALYVGNIFPTSERVRSAGVSRSAEAGGVRYGEGRRHAGGAAQSLSTHPDPQGNWSQEPFMPQPATGMGIPYDPQAQLPTYGGPNY